VRVLVTGARGMLGRELEPRLEQAGFAVLGPARASLDITLREEVLTALDRHRPGLVINCAAYTRVDQAESEAELAFAVNREGARHLAEACRGLGIPLVHLSTDYVFDGRSPQPYREEDPARPLNVYGLSKWEGEEMVRRELPRHLIVRTSWLYGAHGRNFVKTILRLGRQQEEIRVVADQTGCPTWAGDLAAALTSMAERIQEAPGGVSWGTYHFCGAGHTTWYGLAQEILARQRLQESWRALRLVPITTAEYPTAARRPGWTVLDCRKVTATFGITPPPWQQGVAAVLAELSKSPPPRGLA